MNQLNVIIIMTAQFHLWNSVTLCGLLTSLRDINSSLIRYAPVSFNHGYISVIPYV